MPRSYLQIEAKGRLPVRIIFNLQEGGGSFDVLHPSSPADADREYNWDNLSGHTQLTEEEVLAKFAAALEGLRTTRPDAKTPIFKASI